MKSVLISIQPKWCELIASGEKTVEVRKTRPKIDTPFKVYIYCTKPRHYYKISRHLLTSDESLFLVKGKVRMCDGFGVEYEDSEYKHLNCKVIGEFVCDEIYTVNKDSCGWFYGNTNEVMGIMYAEEIEELYHCIPDDELKSYLGHKVGYAWHISNLVIYDKPRKLSEFYVWKKCNSCRDTGYESTACMYDENCKVPAIITRPPQSWCYVQSVI